jgi:hypothetical protein
MLQALVEITLASIFPLWLAPPGNKDKPESREAGESEIERGGLW